MTSPRVAVFSVLYPAAQRYLPSLIEGIKEQTDQCFDFIVALDGVEPRQFLSQWSSSIVTHSVSASAGESPIELRNRALVSLCARYDIIVLVDADDQLLPGRVASARAKLSQFEVCCCPMRLIDAEGGSLQQSFPVGLSIDRLARENVYGFGNSAYRSELLRRCLPGPAQSPLLDWHVISRAMLLGCEAGYEESVHVLYRQHSQNTARVIRPFSEEYVLRATGLVQKHYELLEPFSRASDGAFAQSLQIAMQRVGLFAARIVDDRDALIRYTRALNELADDLVWWSCVGHPALEETWT